MTKRMKEWETVFSCMIAAIMFGIGGVAFAFRIAGITIQKIGSRSFLQLCVLVICVLFFMFLWNCSQEHLQKVRR